VEEAHNKVVTLAATADLVAVDLEVQDLVEQHLAVKLIQVAAVEVIVTPIMDLIQVAADLE
jgi:ribonuclease D